jgi:hypothetical protein
MQRFAYLVATSLQFQRENIPDFLIKFCRSFSIKISVFRQGASPLNLTKRFAGFPALNIGNFRIVLFDKWKFGFYRWTGETGKGFCRVVSANIGRLLFMWERSLIVSGNSIQPDKIPQTEL